eukprot:scaffold72207_cov58-Phaeocystis_antarctica.AAC.1
MLRPAFHASSTAPRPTRHCSTEKAFSCRTGLPPPLAFLPPPLAVLALELAVGTEGRGGSWLPAGCGVLLAAAAVRRLPRAGRAADAPRPATA